MEIIVYLQLCVYEGQKYDGSSCAYLPLQEFINLQLLKANFIYIILSMQIRI